MLDTNHGNRRCFLRKKLQQQRQTLKIVEEFSCEDKNSGNMRRFRICFCIFLHVFFIFVHFSLFLILLEFSSCFLFLSFFVCLHFFIFLHFSSFFHFIFLFFFRIFCPFFSFFFFNIFFFSFLFPVVRADAKTHKKSSRSSYCKKRTNFFWEHLIFGPRWSGNGPSKGDSDIIFKFFFFPFLFS